MLEGMSYFFKEKKYQDGLEFLRSFVNETDAPWQLQLFEAEAWREMGHYDKSVTLYRHVKDKLATRVKGCKAILVNLAEVLVHVTDRHEVADDPAGPVVVNVARAFSAHPDLLDEPLDRAIGYVLGSHLTHVVDLDDHAGMVTAHWDWSGVDPVGFLRMMSTRTAAADEITGWLGFTVAEESESILAAGGSEEVQHARMAHLGSVAGTTVTALLDAGEARARRALADWDKMWSSFSRGLGIISKAFDMAIPPREIVALLARNPASVLSE